MAGRLMVGWLRSPSRRVTRLPYPVHVGRPPAIGYSCVRGQLSHGFYSTATTTCLLHALMPSSWGEPRGRLISQLTNTKVTFLGK